MSRLLLLSLALGGCFPRPDTSVVLENNYPSSREEPLVVYLGFWQAVPFAMASMTPDALPIPPGSSSAPASTVPASGTTAYVVLAPGWDSSSTSPPTRFVVMQSSAGFTVGFDETLVIPVDDTTFIGNCAAGSLLTQDEADFITQRVFQSTFATLRYDASTCTTSPLDDDGGH
jgi:hypothetical protein